MYNANDILKSKTFKMKTKNCKNMMQFAECAVPHLNCICIWSIGNTVTWECRYNINGIFTTIFPVPHKPLLSSAVSTSGGPACVGPLHSWLKGTRHGAHLVTAQTTPEQVQSPGPGPDGYNIAPECSRSSLWHAPWWDHCSGRPPAEPTASSGRNRSV